MNEMHKLNNRVIDDDGLVCLTEQGLIDLLYAGGDFDEIFTFEESNETEKFNKWSTYYKTKSRLIPRNQDKTQEWFIPEEYKRIDLVDFFADKCETQKELERVAEELSLFKQKNMEPILRFMIYLVDFMKERNIVWGVGRGSSVASYCLFLLGLHKVNSIKYNIPIDEFLR